MQIFSISFDMGILLDVFSCYMPAMGKFDPSWMEWFSFVILSRGYDFMLQELFLISSRQIQVMRQRFMVPNHTMLRLKSWMTAC